MSSVTRPLVIAHRGASADAPENTTQAFLAAREQGADVRLTADGSLIVNHDPWYRDGRTVWSTPRSEVPTDVIDLAAALDACAGMGLNLEIKNSIGDLADGPGGPAVVDAVLESLESWSGELLISSFDLPTIDRVKELAPGTRTGYLVFDLNAEPDAAATAADRGHEAFHPWDPFVTDELLQDCRSRGLVVNTWTVDDPVRWRELVDLGVDGIITNAPGRLVAELG
jgi:glycerophosphoryl diester phosphodiesterase